MKQTALVAGLLMMVLLAQGSNGATMPNGPDAEAAQLKAYLVGLRGSTYDPLATVTVTSGLYPGGITTQTMTADASIDQYVAHLQAAGLTSCVPATATDGAPVPAEMVGTICFFEVGNVVIDHKNTPGASCPAMVPVDEGETLAPLGNPFGDIQSDADHVVEVTSTVSKWGKYTPRFGQPSYTESSLHWITTNQAGQRVTLEYIYGGASPYPDGHALRFLGVDSPWLDAQLEAINQTTSENPLLYYRCEVTGNKVYHNSIVTPKVWIVPPT